MVTRMVREGRGQQFDGQRRRHRQCGGEVEETVA